MPVEVRELKWAIVASQHRSLRQAAETLNVRQSTLSRRLRDLEYRLGAPLFERTNGGTRPTSAGQEFLDAARRIVEQTEAIAVRLKTRTRGESGRLTIGVQVSLTAGNLRATLIEHRQRFPGVEIHVLDGSSEHLVADLLSSTADIAFVADDTPRWNDSFLPVWSERVVAAIPTGHPLASQECIHWSELQRQTILLPQRGPGEEFLKLLITKGGHLDASQVVRHDAGLDRLFTLVGAEFGIVLALEGATGAVYPGVTYREVHEAGGPTRVNFRACWREGNVNPSLRPLLEILRNRYPDLSSVPPSR